MTARLVTKRYVARRVPEKGWAVFDTTQDVKVWPSTPEHWTLRRPAHDMRDRLNATERERLARELYPACENCGCPMLPHSPHTSVEPGWCRVVASWAES